MTTGFAAMAFELHTERLDLGMWAESDAGWYRELVNERSGNVLTADDALTNVLALRDRALESGLALLPVHRRDEGDVIGYCGLTVGRSTVEEPEIAYELLRRAHGHGYATEAAAAVVDAAIATGRRRLWATVRDWNVASFRVLDKLGGFERQHSTWDERGELVWNVRDF